jgi:hypothetical protein
MRVALWMCALVGLSALPVNGGEPLRLAVTPAQSLAPATVRIRARVEPSAANRLLAIVADGEDFYRSSEIQLEGDQAPATVELQFSNLPGGNYEFSAVLFDNTGHRRAIARQSARVVSTFGEH